ncbi:MULTISPECIES: ankyrin repeat domain-containing protein [Flavobacteriaceae]|uniref:ankyrin repeat domain-containing protein n=1 Tax=Flavobacteriaceae TaxID=49546 RepID=UPI001492BE9F|nr:MULTISPECIES: ankyrin repeat domain-containing protein [Allomuricauda]MDC6364523.1 ankyrin repeat domain-containing protein [Muricauda sp. AC10]
MKKLICILTIFLYCSNIAAQDIFRTVCKGNLSRLDSLLQDNSINILDSRGRTLLHWSIGCQQKEAFDYLLKKGINLNHKDNDGRTPMYVAVLRNNEEYYDALVDAQPDHSWVELFGSSLLERAIINRSTLFVKKLINSGTNINTINKRGSTPLEIAKRTGNTEIYDLLVTAGGDESEIRSFAMKGAYMGQPLPKTTPLLFAPNFISTEDEEFGAIFNASGTEFYFAAHINGKSEIKFTQLVGNEWSEPKTILSHKTYGYNDPFLSNDENRLYFISKRALDGLGEPKDVDIWYVQKQENEWSEPINVGKNINSERNEYYISFTNDGTMYFGSNANAPEERKRSDYDIYYSKFINGEFQKAIPLGKSVNTPAYEADVFVAPDESYIIFCSTRENGFGQGDLYISFKKPDDTWTKAVSMGNKINTSFYEYCPFVTKDGKYLFYTSNQDIYWVSTEVLKELKENNRK